MKCDIIVNEKGCDYYNTTDYNTTYNTRLSSLSPLDLIKPHLLTHMH